MAGYDYDTAVLKLQESAGNIRCSELKKILEDLGFCITNGTKGKHRTFKHPKIPSFLGGNYDCGHGKDAEIKKFYIRSALEILQQFEKEIKDAQ